MRDVGDFEGEVPRLFCGLAPVYSWLFYLFPEVGCRTLLVDLSSSTNRTFESSLVREWDCMEGPIVHLSE